MIIIFMVPDEYGQTRGINGQTRGINGQTRGINGQQTRGSAPTTAMTVGMIVQWFKTMSTNEYIRNIKNNNWQPFNKLWQRNYYDHIIRNEKSLYTIRAYIKNNPLTWQFDVENPQQA